MGIIDMLAEKSRAEQAAEAAKGQEHVALQDDISKLKQIPAIDASTPTPAVGQGSMIDDKIARAQAMELARVDPEAAMAGATVVSAPPAQKIIPKGEPNPAVAAGVGQPATIATEPEQIPPVGTQKPAEPGTSPSIMDLEQPDQRMAQTPAPPAAAVAEPSFADKLKAIEKKRGRGFLDALQAGLYNFAGITKPTDYEKRVEAEAQEKKDLLDKQWQQEMMKIQQDFQDRQGILEREFQATIAKAKNDWDVQAAKEAYAQQAEQNRLDRQTQLQVAGVRNQQQKAMTLEDLRKSIADWLGS